MSGAGTVGSVVVGVGTRAGADAGVCGTRITKYQNAAPMTARMKSVPIAITMYFPAPLPEEGCVIIPGDPLEGCRGCSKLEKISSGSPFEEALGSRLKALGFGSGGGAIGGGATGGAGGGVAPIGSKGRFGGGRAIRECIN